MIKMNKQTIDQMWQNAMASKIQWEKEIVDHNNKLLETIKHNSSDFLNLINDGGCYINDKIEWVDKPDFEPEYIPEVYGVFTLEYLDQWTIGIEGDSFAGYMYVKVDGYDQYLKISYEC